MSRNVKNRRKTKETNIILELNIDGEGSYNIDTGINFLNHMLESFAKHSLMDLKIKANGDIEVDDHHTVEDIGIILGESFLEAIGDKRGIRRMADRTVPMDDALATVAIDISGRSYCNLDLNFKNEKIGDLTSDNIKHFLESFTNGAKINLYGKSIGENDHHKAEALFKAFAKSMHDACIIEHDKIPSTKGVL